MEYHGASEEQFLGFLVWFIDLYLYISMPIPLCFYYSDSIVYLNNMLGQLLSYSFYFQTFFDRAEYFFFQVNFRISLLSCIHNKNPVGILNKIISIKWIIIPLEKTIQEQCGPLNLLKYNFMSFSWVLCTSYTFWAFLIGVFLYILYFFGYYKW